MMYKVVSWPESQEYMEKEDSIFINDDAHCNSDYAVPIHHFPQTLVEGDIIEYFKERDASSLVAKLIANSDCRVVLDTLLDSLNGYKRREFVEALKEKYIELS